MSHSLPRQSTALLIVIVLVGLAIHALLAVRLWSHVRIPAAAVAGLLLVAVLKHFGIVSVLADVWRKRRGRRRGRDTH